jgi:hypothetical protein
MLSMLPDSLSRGETHSGVETYAWNTTIRQRSNERSLYDVTVAISWENGSYTLRTSLFRTMPVMVLRQ